jgi:sugar phosphate isomerase/epimerase
MQNVLGEPPPGVFAVAASLGFDGVELDWFSPDEAVKGGPLAPERRAEIRKAARTAGVEIPSVCAHFGNHGGLASPDPATPTAMLRAVRDGIALCRDLRATALLVPFFGDGTIDGDEGKARLVGHLRTLAPDAGAAGVTLAIEHTLRGDEAAALLDAVGSPFVADYWDMANCRCWDYDPLEEIASLGGRIACVHAKEYVRDGHPVVRPDERRYPGLNAKPFGAGDVPVRAILEALRAVGYTGWVTLETGAFGDKKQSARAALEHLRQEANG